MSVVNYLKVQLLSEDATLPQRSDDGAAGLDLFAAENITIFPGEIVIVNTQIAIEMETGIYGRIASRSGLAAEYGLIVLGGVVDSSYRGPIKVIMTNLGTSFYIVTRGERIAQLILEKYLHAIPVIVPHLTPTGRGDRGFGSSGSSVMV